MPFLFFTFHVFIKLLASIVSFIFEILYECIAENPGSLGTYSRSRDGLSPRSFQHTKSGRFAIIIFGWTEGVLGTRPFDSMEWFEKISFKKNWEPIEQLL